MGFHPHTCNHDLKNKLQSSKEHLLTELSSIRTGRASTTLVENILVDAYEGTPPLTLKELATLSSHDAQTILIDPWDKSVTQKIVSAIQKSNTGLNPLVDGPLIKVPVPSLTTERREEFVKLVGKKIEDTKVAIRNIRQDAMRSLDEQKENGILSEDEYFSQREEVESEVKKSTAEIEEIGKMKKEELMRI